MKNAIWINQDSFNLIMNSTEAADRVKLMSLYEHTARSEPKKLDALNPVQFKI